MNRVGCLLLRDSLYAVVHFEGYAFEYLTGKIFSLYSIYLRHSIYLKGHRVKLSPSVNDSFRNRAPGTPGSSELFKGRLISVRQTPHVVWLLHGIGAQGSDLLLNSFCSFLTSKPSQI